MRKAFRNLIPLVASAAPLALGQGAGAPAPYTADGRLNFPSGYREWIFLSSGMDMSYSAQPSAAEHSRFDNVFVNPQAYREFLHSGHWPEGTLLVLEVRGAAQSGSINRRGRFQTSQLLHIEVHAKDSKRFPGGWAFFGFPGTAAAAPIALSEDCYACHREHGAVDTTFVQFYPVLLEVATQKNTVDRRAEVSASH